MLIYRGYESCPYAAGLAVCRLGYGDWVAPVLVCAGVKGKKGAEISNAELTEELGALFSDAFDKFNIGFVIAAYISVDRSHLILPK